jgi:hypothetical protein
VINLLNEAPISLSEASRLLPGRPHIATIHRWRLRGVRGVCLETVLVGGRRYTSRQALERFLAATTAAGGNPATPIRTPSQRERAIAEAEREVAAGI